MVFETFCHKIEQFPKVSHGFSYWETVEKQSPTIANNKTITKNKPLTKNTLHHHPCTTPPPARSYSKQTKNKV
jgi:hypothetical protein